MTTPAEMRALATTLEKIAPHVDTDYGPGQVATYGLAWEALRSAADEIEVLEATLVEQLEGRKEDADEIMALKTALKNLPPGAPHD